MIRCYSGFLALGMTLFSPFTSAALVPLNLDGHMRVSGGGNYQFGSYSSPNYIQDINAPPKLVYPSTKLTIPTSVGVKDILIKDVALPVAAGRIGRAAGLLYKANPYILAASIVAPIFCTVTDVCHWPDADGNDAIQKVTHVPAGYKWQVVQASPVVYYTTPELACNAAASAWGFRYDKVTCMQNDAANYLVVVDGYPYAPFTTLYKNFAIGSVVRVGNLMPAKDTYAPMTDTDWEALYAYWDANHPTLSQINIMASFVYNNKGNVPVDDPVFAPVEAPVGHTETTVRDGSGTATGTSITDTTVKVEPNPTVPGTAKTTETTTTTVTNITNNTSNTTTTVNSTPDNAPPEKTEPTIEIDNVPDVDLPTYKNPATFDSTSWGEGSCPANPSVNTQFGAITVPFEPICNSMTLIRPAIILISLLVAAFIVSGARKND